MGAVQAVLAIDIGSSSVRACAFDLQGRALGPGAQRNHQLGVQAPGAATLDPAALLRDLGDTLDAALHALPARCEIVGVGISAFWHSLLGVDALGHPTTPILTWADRRAAAHAAQLRATADAPALHRATGCRLHSGFWPARLRWLAQAEPAWVERTSRWLSVPDQLFGELFGAWRTSVSMASGTGLFDIHALQWCDAALRTAGIDVAQLAEVDDAPLAGLRPAYAQRWPQLARVPWYPAVGDGACSNLGAGCTDLRSLVLMLGTSGSLRMVWEADDTVLGDDGLFCYRVDARRFAGGMALSEGGAVAAWARQLQGERSAEDLERAVAALAPDTHGLTVLPFLLGTRSPDWVEGRTGALTGVTAATGPLQIYRAMLEGVGLRFALLHGRLQQAWPGARRIVGTGAALLKSPAWAQIMADCLGHEIEVSGVDEGSLRGAALLAVLRHGAAAELVDYPCRQVLRPDPHAHAVYQEAMARQQRLDQAMRTAFSEAG